MGSQRSRRDRVIYHFESDGFTSQGAKIPDIPIVYLAIRVDKKIAYGPAIVDTGFDGGVLPNLPIVKLFAGVPPQAQVEFENPLYGMINCEVYSADGYLYSKGTYHRIGKINVYIPTEPEYLSEEVIVGQEILNKFDLYFDSNNKLLTVSF